MPETNITLWVNYIKTKFKNKTQILAPRVEELLRNGLGVIDRSPSGTQAAPSEAREGLPHGISGPAEYGNSTGTSFHLCPEDSNVPMTGSDRYFRGGLLHTHHPTPRESTDTTKDARWPPQDVVSVYGYHGACFPHISYVAQAIPRTKTSRILNVSKTKIT